MTSSSEKQQGREWPDVWLIRDWSSQRLDSGWADVRIERPERLEPHLSLERYVPASRVGEPSPGVVHPVDKAFHDLAVKERNHAWEESARHKRERDEATQQSGDGLELSSAAIDHLREIMLRRSGINRHGCKCCEEIHAALSARASGGGGE
jgi:hypothetical protein